MWYLTVSIATIFINGVLTAETFKLLNCAPKSSATISIPQFPSPFMLENNATFSLSAGVSLREKLPTSIRLEIDLAKKIGIWVKIPCIGCDRTISCKEFPQLCVFREMCPQCSMAVKDILITLPGDIEQKIPGYIPNLVINGYYWAQVRALDDKDRSKVVACLETYVYLQKSKK